MSADSKPAPISRPRVAAALQRLNESRPGEGLEIISEIVSQLLGCEEHALLAVEEGREHLLPVTVVGIPRERLDALLVPQGIIGQVSQHGVPYVIGRTSSIGVAAHEAGLTACIPLMHAKQVRGVLALFRMLPQKRGLSDEDLELLDLLSTRGATALLEPWQGTTLVPLTPVPADSSGSEPGALRTLYLEPGGVVAAVLPTEVTTILGSSVAVCLWEEQLRLGGMIHFLLPTAPEGQPGSSRHGGTAIPMLLKDLERLGSDRRNLQAKVFGGAHMAGTSPAGATPSLGQRNADLARRMLAEAGIRIVAEDTGGNAGRKLSFRTDDGTVLIKTLGGS